MGGEEKVVGSTREREEDFGLHEREEGGRVETRVSCTLSPSLWEVVTQYYVWVLCLHT